MKTENLMGYIFLIIIGLGLNIYSIHTKKVQKKEGRYSFDDSVRHFGVMFMGIIIILLGLLNILLL
jgi:hypothetical protein